MPKKQVTKKEVEEFIKFLEKAVASKNLMNSDPHKHEKLKEKLEKERLKFKLLFK